MYLINSTIFVEDADGNVVGEVRQRFHVWQRNYDIYLDRQQFAAINSPLLAWEFAIRDESGGGLPLLFKASASVPLRYRSRAINLSENDLE